MLQRHRRYNPSRRWLSRRFEKVADDIQEYQTYVCAAGTQIGELSPLRGEDVQEIAFKVRNAALAMGWRARTWVDGGKVYFFVLKDIPRGL